MKRGRTATQVGKGKRQRRAGPSAAGSSVPGFTRTGGFYKFQPGVGRGEKKFFDTLVTSGAMAVAGTVQSGSINLVNQGNAETNMIGRKITITAINLKGRIEMGEEVNAAITNVPGATQYRLAVVLDTQANGAAGTIATLYQNADVNTFINLENSQRYRVLKEWKGALRADVSEGTSGFSHGRAIRYIKWYHKCQIPVEFSPMAGGSRVIGEVRSNNVFVVAFSAGNDVATATWRTRIRFADA